MNDNSFKPFVPAEKNLPEFTATSIILGILLAVLFEIGRASCRERV